MADVSLENVTKKYGDFIAVNDFSFNIGDGEFVTLLGPSGCGKTTLLRSIAGFFPVTHGRIAVNGKVLSDPSQDIYVAPEKRNLGMVFQSYAVWPHMNVFKNVAYPLKLQRMSKDEIQKRVGKILDMLNLVGQENKSPSELSGGQQQRVALGRSLVMEPDALLLDEPLSNLDAKLRDHMRFELKEIQRRMKLTIVYVTHDQDEAMAISDRIVLMESGEIRQSDKPRAMFERPANLFSARFIGRSNFIKGTVKSLKGRQAVLGLTDGAEIPFVPSSQVQANEGEQVDAVIRYQDVEVAAKPGKDTVEAKVVVSTYLGGMLLYEFESVAGRIVAQTNDDVTFDDGGTAFLRFPNVHLFRPENSGKVAEEHMAS